MFKSFLLASALATSSINPLIGDYPKNVSEPMHQVENEGINIKYWLFLDPKCIIETTSTSEGPLISEITFLNPEDTSSAQAISFILKIEGLESLMQFGGMNEEQGLMYTMTDTGHYLKWERDLSSGKIKKVTIIYHNQSLES